MRLEPYLHFNGNCEAALKYYEKELGAKIEAILPFSGAPDGMPLPPGWENKVMHARILIGESALMASDAPQGHFKPMQGCSITLQVDEPKEAERRFNALLQGGSVTMPFGPTFFAKGFGICVDQFGIQWMVNCPLEQ